MSHPVPKISESEWVIMRELWKAHPRTAMELIQSLENRSSWSPTTIKTLLNRLVGKGAIGFEKRSREYLYFPLVSEEACVHAESASFLERVFGGALAPMLATFIEHKTIPQEELEQLKRLLETQSDQSHDATSRNRSKS